MRAHPEISIARPRATVLVEGASRNKHCPPQSNSHMVEEVFDLYVVI